MYGLPHVHVFEAEVRFITLLYGRCYAGSSRCGETQQQS